MNRGRPTGDKYPIHTRFALDDVICLAYLHRCMHAVDRRRSVRQSRTSSTLGLFGHYSAPGRDAG